VKPTTANENNVASSLHFDNLRYIVRYIEIRRELCLNKKRVMKDGVDGEGMGISIMERNGTAAGIEALAAQWGMTGALVAEAVASGTSTTGNCGS
jgi:hypothetical protein